MKMAKEIRQETTINPKTKFIQWPERRGRVKMTPIVVKMLHNWIQNHDHVKTSLMSNDTLLIKDETTGKKERVTKLLAEIPVRELRNDLCNAVVEKGELLDLLDIHGNVKVSDLPPELKRATM